MPWVGLRCVVVLFSDQTHLLFNFYHGYLVSAIPPTGLALLEFYQGLKMCMRFVIPRLLFVTF